MTPERIERRSIIITIVASVSFGLIGVVISLASQSGAVFLDGVFSLIFAVVGLLTLYVSGLVQRPRDEQYPFGYATFEPMLNLFKGILITLALLYALWSAVTALMTGGQEVAAVGGIVYAAIAVSGGAALAVVLRKLAQRSGSPIVQVDAQNAVIDTLISGSVGVAFVATLLLQNSRWSQWARYADPVIMLAIAAIAAPQPVRIIRSNWRQILGRAPEPALRERVAALVDKVLLSVPHAETYLRLTEMGRYLYIHLYVIVPEDAPEPIDTRLHDRIRQRIHDALAAEFPYLALDIGFTMDRRWALEQRTDRGSHRHLSARRRKRRRIAGRPRPAVRRRGAATPATPLCGPRQRAPVTSVRRNRRRSSSGAPQRSKAVPSAACSSATRSGCPVATLRRSLGSASRSLSQVPR